MSFWEEWFKRWRRPLFADLDRAFEEMFREISGTLPKELFRERKLPDGSIVRTFGPAVYGYSMTIGPDGKPEVKTFGNIRPELGVPKPVERREPLIDVIPGPKHVRVIAELPGVEKSDIDLRAEEERIAISVDTPERKYFKEIGLPARVDPKSATASYRNGVLEVLLNKLEERRPGERVEIE